MPSALPEGEAVPRDGSLPASSYAGLGTRPIGRLPARAVLRGALRLLRLQHLHGHRAGRRCLAGVVRRHSRRGGAARPPGAGRRRRARRDRVPRRRYADAAAAARPGAAARPPYVTSSASCPAPRSPPRPTPTASTRRRWRRCARPGSPGSRSACSRRCRTCSRPSTAPTTPTGCRRPSAGPGPPASRASASTSSTARRARATDDWRASLDAAIGLRARPHQRLRPDRRGGHPAGRTGPPRRDRGAGRRRPRRPLPARRRAAGRRRVRLVRGEQLGPRRVAAGPAQRGLLARARLVGRRPGSAQPRRRHPVVERAAPHGVRRPAGRRRQPRRTPARCSTDEQRRVERVLLGIRLREGHPLSTTCARPAGGLPTARPRTGCSTRPRTPTAAQR